VPKASAIEVASIGPIRITYAFRSWVLLEVPGRGSLRRRVRSEDELGRLLAELGLPPKEADAVGDRLWDARPSDAGLSNVRPWETWAASTGLTSLQLFLLVVALAGVVALIAWLIA
jgi:hypothetical protein